MLSIIAGPTLFVTELSYIMVLDVRRIRLRAQILAISDPGSDLHRRNLPQRTTKWGADTEIVDKWSARVLGVWWFGRTAYCLLAGAALLAFFAWLHRPSDTGSSLVVCVTLPGFLWQCHQRLGQTKADLTIAQLHYERISNSGVSVGAELREGV